MTTKTNYKKNNLNVKVSDGMYEKVTTLAENKDMTITDYVRFLIQQQIDLTNKIS
jgi:predicted transcriptional regulator